MNRILNLYDSHIFFSVSKSKQIICISALKIAQSQSLLMHESLPSEKMHNLFLCDSFMQYHITRSLINAPTIPSRRRCIQSSRFAWMPSMPTSSKRSWSTRFFQYTRKWKTAIKGRRSWSTLSMLWSKQLECCQRLFQCIFQ